jgi:DNA polymerase V
VARSEALKAVTYTEITLPVSGHKICAGFPSPADDYLDENIDLARLLCQNQPATFLMWVVNPQSLVQH